MIYAQLLVPGLQWFNALVALIFGVHNIHVPVPFDELLLARVFFVPETQGMEKLIERYRNMDIMHWKVLERFRPILYAAGARVGFPSPTRRISPPKPFKTRGAAR